jgi:hypothetical protein
MEMLFDIEIQDSDSVYSNINDIVQLILGSPLEDKAQEDNAVLYIYDVLQKTLGTVIDTGWCFAEEIYANSTRDIYATSSKIISSGVPTVISPVIDLSNGGLENSQGLMTSSVVKSKYAEFYWSMGDYVEIVNNSIVPYTANVFLDSILTREILYGFFLINEPEQLLSRCKTLNVPNGDILSTSVSGKRAINYGDMKRFFFLKSDIIDMSENIVKSSYDTVVGERHVKSKSLSSPGKIKASKVLAGSGTVTLEAFDTSYLKKGGYISNSSALPQSIITNAVILGDASIELSTGYAPKIDWTTSTLKKADSKTSTFLSSLVTDVISNTSPDDTRGEHSAVRKDELSQILDELIAEISVSEACE